MKGLPGYARCSRNRAPRTDDPLVPGCSFLAPRTSTSPTPHGLPEWAHGRPSGPTARAPVHGNRRPVAARGIAPIAAGVEEVGTLSPPTGVRRATCWRPWPQGRLRMPRPSSSARGGSGPSRRRPGGRRKRSGREAEGEATSPHDASRPRARRTWLCGCSRRMGRSARPHTCKCPRAPRGPLRALLGNRRGLNYDCPGDLTHSSGGTGPNNNGKTSAYKLNN